MSTKTKVGLVANNSRVGSISSRQMAFLGRKDSKIVPHPVRIVCALKLFGIDVHANWTSVFLFQIVMLVKRNNSRWVKWRALSITTWQLRALATEKLRHLGGLTLQACVLFQRGRFSSPLKIFKESAGSLWRPPAPEFPVWLVNKSLSHKEF